MPGARIAPAALCAKEVRAHKHSHHGHTGTTRHSPRNGFNGFLRALPGDRACLPPSQATMRKHRRRLDASVGASGPHDFAVRLRAARLQRQNVHRIPHPTFVTIAKRPSRGSDGMFVNLIWVK